MENSSDLWRLEVGAAAADLQLSPALSQDWRKGLPILTGHSAILRELRASDAAALFSALSSDKVTRYISPPPSTVEGLQRFIDWGIRQRQEGRFACFAVVPHGSETAAGLFQVRSLEPAFETAEWGFVLAPDFWGTGLFVEAARLLMEFAFTTLGVRRLEARAALQNGRGNAALRKLGAVPEGVLRRSFLRNGEALDQALWATLRDEWIRARTVLDGASVH